MVGFWIDFDLINYVISQKNEGNEYNITLFCEKIFLVASLSNEIIYRQKFKYCQISKEVWGEPVIIVTCSANRSPSMSFDHLKVFGCNAYIIYLPKNLN